MKEQSKVLEALAPVAKNLDTLQNKVTQIEEGRRGKWAHWEPNSRGSTINRPVWTRKPVPCPPRCATTRCVGAWGEAQLKNIVESAGLLEHVDFDTQVVVTDADGRTVRPI